MPYGSRLQVYTYRSSQCSPGYQSEVGDELQMKKISNPINIKKCRRRQPEYYERGVLCTYLTCKDKARLITKKGSEALIPTASALLLWREKQIRTIRR